LESTLLVLLIIVIISVGCSALHDRVAGEVRTAESFYPSSKPMTRWWWFADKIDARDIEEQLDWLKANRFGGVEIAWIYPPGRDPDTPRFEWLGEEWSQVITHTKCYADSIDLHCDFTFGTLWPFGASFVPDEDRTKVYGEPEFKQRLRLSWEHPQIGNVVDHLDRGAFERYAQKMGSALGAALQGSRSALFCDSWEVETRRLWTDGFGAAFEKQYGYDLRPYMEEIYDAQRGDERYDYMKLLSQYVIENFYIPFTEYCHAQSAFSRVQCAGSPTDLIRAYASVDVPETEAMLYEPNFARVPASAAAMASAPLVSAESFTCLYGYPDNHLGEERIEDLKLVVDALFANGVNHIIWHGMPYNRSGDDSNRFYATVHVGRNGKLTPELPAFNRYIEQVAGVMRRGRTYSDVAVYLPLEDAWIAGEYPQELQFPWAWGAYELRYVHVAEELKGYHPLWINHDFLKRGALRDGVLCCGEARFSSLYIDVDHLDSEALATILDLAERGFPVCLKKRPRQPGRLKSATYREQLDRLERLENVSSDFREVAVNPPLVSGAALPDYWCRIDGDRHYLFFAHPLAQNLQLPLEYGLAGQAARAEQKVILTIDGHDQEVVLDFAPGQSLLLEVLADGTIAFVR